MRHPVKDLHHANSLSDLHQPHVRPHRSHFSSPAVFFSDRMRRPRRNFGYHDLALTTTKRSVK